jgi:adenylate cyclase
MSYDDATAGRVTTALPKDSGTHPPAALDTVSPSMPVRIDEVPKGRLLIVDDVEENRDLLSRRVGREGYSVAMASNGREALDMLSKWPFDLVLLDIMMPEIDGLTVLRQVKQDPHLRDIPVVMISAVDEVASVAECIENGAEDYLPKPFNHAILRSRIRASLERKRLRDVERERTKELEVALAEVERQRQLSEHLLLNILPKGIAEELRERGSVDPMYFEDVTIAFTDFVGFTRSTELLAAEDIVHLLNEYFSGFDLIMERYGLEKIKTIGDSYMFVGGLPVRNPSHPIDMVLAAFEIINLVEQKSVTAPNWSVRVGMHTGPAIAGVVGIHKFAFDIWGDSVNLASRMESSGAPNRINLSERTYARVKDFFACESRGKVQIKDGREFEMYFVNSVLSSLTGDTANLPSGFARRYKTYFKHELRSFPACLY